MEQQIYYPLFSQDNCWYRYWWLQFTLPWLTTLLSIGLEYEFVNYEYLNTSFDNKNSWARQYLNTSAMNTWVWIFFPDYKYLCCGYWSPDLASRDRRRDGSFARSSNSNFTLMGESHFDSQRRNMFSHMLRDGGNLLRFEHNILSKVASLLITHWKISSV